MSKGYTIRSGKCLFPVVRIAEAEVLCECFAINRFTRRDLIYTALIWEQIRAEFGRAHVVKCGLDPLNLTFIITINESLRVRFFLCTLINKLMFR